MPRKDEHRARRGVQELGLWLLAGALGLVLAGTFVLVVIVLLTPPPGEASRKPAKRAKKAPASAPAPVPPKPKPPEPGLVGRYYEFRNALQDFPDLEKEKPKLTRVDPAVDFDPTGGVFHGTGLADNFAVRWEGLVRIPRDGEWTFFTVSDDGSRLEIDGKRVVDNPGLHAMEERPGKVTLKKGDHAIRIDYFEGGSEAGCRVLWEGPDTPKAPIPPGALLHPAAP